MVPLLRVRTIIVLALGLVLGLAAGFGYSAMSGSTTEYQSSHTLGIWGGDVTSSTRDLQAEADEYLAKLNSFAYLSHFADILNKEAPQYSHTAQELDDMIKPLLTTTRSTSTSSSRPKITVYVQSPDPDEALYICQTVPYVLRNYISKQQADVLLQIEAVKADLIAANEQLANITLQINIYNLNVNPEYIALQNLSSTLQRQLDLASTEMATATALGNLTTSGYQKLQDKINRLSVALAEANSEITTMEAQSKAKTSVLSQDYDLVDRTITALNNRLQQLANSVAVASIASSTRANSVDFVELGNATAVEEIVIRDIPRRTALGIGGILGLGCVFVALNYKWLLGIDKSSSGPGSGDDQGDSETLYLYERRSVEKRDSVKEIPEATVKKE